MSFGGLNHSSYIEYVARTAAERPIFAAEAANKMVEWGYDGIDIDLEFPGDGGCTAAEHLALMQAVYAAVKAKGTQYVVMFGISPGYYISQYQWSQLASVSDYGFHMCYDWYNPANGPMTNPGQTLNVAGGGSIEASCRGAINYAINAGYPASKIVMGMPFYSTSWTLWMDAPSAVLSVTPHASYMEAYYNSQYWTTPAAINRKMDAVLSPASSVLTGGATLGGVGFWEWGHENPASPALSAAIKARIGTY